MPGRIEFFFDCSSPWTYLAFHNVQPLAREFEAEIVWRPILVGGVFNAVNRNVYRDRDNPVPAKDTYMAKDMQDWARAADIKILWRPTIFPINSVRAMRGCLVADRSGELVDFARRVFEAYWRDDRDIASDEVLIDLASVSGLPTDAFLEMIAAPEIKDRLRANTDELIARGGFGSPTMFVNGDDMYFGNDRLLMVLEALVRHR